VFVDFFGRPAATTTLPALLHLRTGSPILLVYNLRDGLKFKIVYERILLPSLPDSVDRVLVYTQLITQRMENLIRQYPENWFWIHNRWKRKPEPASPPASLVET
jgi:KDO2-lipid IV(A) lauroyltransferase